MHGLEKRVQNCPELLLWMTDQSPAHLCQDITNQILWNKIYWDRMKFLTFTLMNFFNLLYFSSSWWASHFLFVVFFSLLFSTMIFSLLLGKKNSIILFSILHMFRIRPWYHIPILRKTVESLVWSEWFQIWPSSTSNLVQEGQNINAAPNVQVPWTVLQHILLSSKV